MSISRRGFIQLIASAVAAGAVLDVEKLFWVPKPMIVVPAMPVVTPMLTMPGSLNWLEHMNHLLAMDIIKATGIPVSALEPDLKREMRSIMIGRATLEQRLREGLKS